MKVLEPIEPQFKFPEEDLTEDNAKMLGLILGNSQALKFGHIAAEEQYPIFHGTHPSLVLASRNIYYDPSRIRHIEAGIIAFEAITALVRADRHVPIMSALEVKITLIIDPRNSDQISEYFTIAQDEFQNRTPRTAEVIAESSQKYNLDTRFTSIGAAAARQFHLDNT